MDFHQVSEACSKLLAGYVFRGSLGVGLKRPIKKRFKHLVQFERFGGFHKDREDKMVATGRVENDFSFWGFYKGVCSVDIEVLSRVRFFLFFLCVDWNDWNGWV
jgi:hypothetical protein